MNTKHTPGPWFQVEGPQYGYNKLLRVESASGKFGTVICERFAADKVDGLKEEVEANMALIAAAPDLLRLAQEVAKLNHKQERIGPGMMATLLEMADKAIAKATDNTQTT
jgi:hypothetical protein